MTFKNTNAENIFMSFVYSNEQQYKTTNNSLFYCPYRASLYSYGYYQIAYKEDDIIHIYKRIKSNTTSKQINALIEYCETQGIEYIIYEWKQKGKREYKQYLKDVKTELLKMTSNDTADEIIKYMSNDPVFTDKDGNQPIIYDLPNRL